jgi:MFS family permease
MTDKNPTPPSPDGRTGWRSILLLLTVAGTAFALMQTLVVPALPFFQREFDTTANGVAWIVTGFLLSSSVLTPVLGKLGDTYGKKRLLVISLVVFGVGALGAAVSWSLESLIAFRVLQGAGAAVFPLSFGIIRDEFPPEKVGLGIGVVSSVFGAGGGVGLVASGIILEYLDWHWLFLIGGIPVLVAAAVIARHVPESQTLTPTKPDYAGAAALSFALATLLLGISQGNAWGWSSARVIGLLAASALFFALWAVIERRVREPMVDLGMLARPKMAATNAITFLVGFAMFSAFISLPNFVQMPAGLPAGIAERAGYGFGASPIESGLFFVPSSLAMIFAGPDRGLARLPARRGGAPADRASRGGLGPRPLRPRPRRAVAHLHLDGSARRGDRLLSGRGGQAGGRQRALPRDRRRLRDQHDHAHSRGRPRRAGRRHDHLGQRHSGDRRAGRDGLHGRVHHRDDHGARGARADVRTDARRAARARGG